MFGREKLFSPAALLFLSCFLATLVFFAVIVVPKASAVCSYDTGTGYPTATIPNNGDYYCPNPPTAGSPDPLRELLYTPWLVTSLGGMNTPAQSSLIHISADVMSTSVIIQNACDNDSTYDNNDPEVNTHFYFPDVLIGAVSVTTTSANISSYVSGGITYYRCNSGSDISFNLTALTANPGFYKSIRLSNGTIKNYFATKIIAYINTGDRNDFFNISKAANPQATYENQFRVITNGSIVNGAPATYSSYASISKSDEDSIFTPEIGNSFNPRTNGTPLEKMTGVYNLHSRIQNPPISNFYDRDKALAANYWASKLAFAIPCESNLSQNDRTRKIFFYDSDRTTLQDIRPLRFRLTATNRNTGVQDGSKTVEGILTGGDDRIDSAFDDTITVGAGNLTADKKYVFDRDFIYTLEVYDVYVLNSIQVALPFDQINSLDTCTPPPNPIGWAEACQLVGNNTVIYGWAYDTDTTTGPSINLNVANSPSGTYSTATSDNVIPPAYATMLNNFLGSTYGTGAKDDRYGWSITVPGLVQGTNYTLSGTIVNSGPGQNVALGIDENPPPSEMGSGYYGIFSGNLPNECLNTGPTLSCQAFVDNVRNPTEPIQPGDFIRYRVTVSNGAGAGTATYTTNNVSFTAAIPAGYNVAQVNYGTLTGGQSATVTYGDFQVPTNQNIGTFNFTCNVPAGPTNVSDTVDVIPYVKMYGNDVVAGAGFGLCAAGSSSSDIKARYGINLANALAGSGSQLAARALGTINRYQPGSVNGLGSSLGFANTGISPVPDNTAVFGGSFGNGGCVDDFWADSVGATAVAGGSVPNSDGKFSMTSGSSLTGVTNAHSAVFVDGNVFITGTEIRYGSTTWANIDAIPSFALVVRGNIFIASTVTRLDGLYIAQPNGAAGGNIYTCNNGASASPLSLTSQTDRDFIANQCSQKLIVNGAFYAQKVHFLRAPSFTEALRNQPANVGNVNQATVNEGRTTTKAGEVFIFSPEMYLARWATDRLDNALPATSILSLPPSF